MFKTTITKMIFGKFETLCSVCQVGEGDDHLLKLNCQCSFCEKCLVDYINNSTDGKILLNQYEKSNFFFIVRRII